MAASERIGAEFGHTPRPRRGPELTATPAARRGAEVGPTPEAKRAAFEDDNFLLPPRTGDRSTPAALAAPPGWPLSANKAVVC